MRQKWSLTQDAFDRLLLSLGGDRESGGEKYLEIRRNHAQRRMGPAREFYALLNERSALSTSETRPKENRD